MAPAIAIVFSTMIISMATAMFLGQAAGTSGQIGAISPDFVQTRTFLVANCSANVSTIVNTSAHQCTGSQLSANSERVRCLVNGSIQHEFFKGITNCTGTPTQKTVFDSDTCANFGDNISRSYTCLRPVFQPNDYVFLSEYSSITCGGTPTRVAEAPQWCDPKANPPQRFDCTTSGLLQRYWAPGSGNCSGPVVSSKLRAYDACDFGTSWRCGPKIPYTPAPTLNPNTSISIEVWPKADVSCSGSPTEVARYTPNACSQDAAGQVFVPSCVSNQMCIVESLYNSTNCANTTFVRSVGKVCGVCYQLPNGGSQKFIGCSGGRAVDEEFNAPNSDCSGAPSAVNRMPTQCLPNIDLANTTIHFALQKCDAYVQKNYAPGSGCSGKATGESIFAAGICLSGSMAVCP